MGQEKVTPGRDKRDEDEKKKKRETVENDFEHQTFSSLKKRGGGGSEKRRELNSGESGLLLLFSTAMKTRFSLLSLLFCSLQLTTSSFAPSLMVWDAKWIPHR